MDKKPVPGFHQENDGAAGVENLHRFTVIDINMGEGLEIHLAVVDDDPPDLIIVKTDFCG